MIQIILAQLGRQQTTHKGRLATTLRANQRRHTLVAVKRVHLQPVCHSGTNPDSEETVLFRAETRQSAEDSCHMILPVPLRQAVEELSDGIKERHLFRLHIHLNLCTRTSLLQNDLTFCSEDDAVESL